MAPGTSSFISLYQFALLIWKGFLLRKRHYIVTLIEIFFPILIASIPVIIYAETQKSMGSSVHLDKVERSPVNEYKNATYYDPFDPRDPKQFSSDVYIIFTPNTTLATSLTSAAVNYWKEENRTVNIHDIIGVRTEADLEDEALGIQINLKDQSSAIIGLVYNNFADSKDVPKSLDYKIRYGSRGGNFKTSEKYPPFSIGPNMFDFNEYITSAFLAVQSSVDYAFIGMHKGQNISTKVMMQKFPYPPYDEKKSGFTVQDQAGMFLCFGFIALVYIITKRVIEEKANRSKELLKMMGMTDCVYWTSTFMNFFITFLVVCIVMLVLYKVPYYGSDPFLAKTEPFLLLILLLMISASTILFCFMFTTFINRPVLGSVIIIIVWNETASLLSAYLFGPNKYLLEPLSSRLAICLLPPGATLVIFKFLSSMEFSGEGVQWYNLCKFTVAPDQNLLMVLAVVLASCVMYSVLIWYIDAVCPWQYGVPKPFYFPFTKAYWCGRKSETVDCEADKQESREYFEEEPSGTSPGIVIDHLTKVFRTGLTSKTAVDDLSLKIYHGQITAVLGHNGAGKTTTINMLTGLYPPTKGTALIDGWDIVTHLKHARRSLGICPQHDVLYDTLTTEEHLMLYAGLKGVNWSSLNSEASEVLRLLKLEDKSKELSKNLSGGMKRKLALGIAIIGDSKVLFLDEPTSGMDPESRRSVWDMLLNIRNERTIVLTTHYMEEADILGDRIAIIAAGAVQCYGSPMFLKRIFGTGYHLHITKEPECILENVTSVLKEYIPGTTLESSTEREATYSFLEGTPSMYGKMFEELERQRIELAVGSFGMSVTTMEDVFIKVTKTASSGVMATEEEKMADGHSAETLLIEDDISKQQSTTHDVFSQFPKLEGFLLLVQQMKGLLIKRLHHTKRHWTVFITRLILPFLMNMMMVWMIYSNVDAPNSEKPLLLELSAIYGRSEGFYSYDNSQVQTFAETYLETTLRSSGVDVKNVSNPDSFIIKYGQDNILNYITDLLIGGSATFSNETFTVTAWFNSIPYHTAPVTLNVIDTALLRNISGVKNATITVTNAPLPLRKNLQDSDFVFVEIITAAYLPLSLAFLSSSFIYVPVYENASKAKLLQLMTGVSTFLYWLMMFTWDILVTCACCIILLIPFGFFNGDVFFGHAESIGTIFFMFLLYGWGSIPLCYLISLVIKKASTAGGVLTTVKVISGTVFAVVFRILPESDGVEIALWFMRLMPTFAATWGVGKVLRVSFSNSFCDRIPKNVLKYSCPTLEQSDEMFKCCTGRCGEDCFKKIHPLTWESTGCGKEALILFLDGILFFAILLLAESQLARHLFRRLISVFPKLNTRSVQPNVYNNISNHDDDDVTSEADRVTQLDATYANNEALLVLGLTKYYNSICAVDGLKFGVHLEECFGLLGVNGAGKTSTFKMLAGDIEPTEGNAFLKDSNLCDNIKKFQTYLGYCPQYDALIDNLSGREMLTLFARLRGIPEISVHEYVCAFINMVDLQDHSDKPTKAYSGGNKRKLSLALALVGNPSLILLDEPTCGVDPVARRKIWNVLSQVRTVSGSSIILTTHSMEESEALCSRLAIMVNGRFRCLGSIQHLKSKFGQGYTVIAKLKREQLVQDPFMRNAKDFIQRAFPSASLKDDHQGMLHYHIPDASIPWSQMFNKMEELKQELQLDDYQISDTTLEQIFLAFARNQRVSAEVV